MAASTNMSSTAQCAWERAKRMIHRSTFCPLQPTLEIVIWVGIIWHSAIPGRVTDIKQKMEENGMKTEVDLERQGIM